MFLPSFLNKIWHIEEILSLLILSIRKFQKKKIMSPQPRWPLIPTWGANLGLFKSPNASTFISTRATESNNFLNRGCKNWAKKSITNVERKY